MSLGSIVRFLLPRDDKFLNYFEQAADNLKKAGSLYADLTRVNSRAEMVALREEIKRLEGIYVTQGARVTLMDGKEVNCNLLTSIDVGKTKLRDVKYVSALNAVSDEGMGKWYGYTAEFDQKQ